MKMNFRPKNRLGKWAIGFGIALVISAAISLFFAAFIKGDASVIAANPVLSVLANILSITFTLTGFLSFIFGIATIVKYKDWLLAKALVVLYIGTLIIFLLGEFLFTH